MKIYSNFYFGFNFRREYIDFVIYMVFGHKMGFKIKLRAGINHVSRRVRLFRLVGCVFIRLKISSSYSIY